MAVIEFDNELKTLLYRPLMKIETAIKSITCDAILTTVGSSSFSKVFEKGFDFSCEKEKKYRERDSVYQFLTKRYQYSDIIKHFYNNDEPVPLWAIIEEMMLGEVSSLIEVLLPCIKLRISNSIGIPQGLNSNGDNLPKVLNAVKDLRNAVAHNKVLFDGRYMEFKKRGSIVEIINQVTGIPNVNCRSLFDDIALLCIMLNSMGMKKEEARRIVTGMTKALESLKNKLPNMLFQDIASGFRFEKIDALKAYLGMR